ncbi:hypothetical protein PQ469_26310 [Mucilaginibacter sp. KACC 22773]|uniref:hypothetical protein n=1 Tax=Mucilaginibacter sp. KACC 22773 TaxID=3025671 RepID=UPI00236671C4|nr:hypothetical protein [Mucilaginibacter sp. KACC 22773]WDF77402.1 hypothetical protein PQ469_26310 [Mucilaginibacter sp. KACC 22773]
MNCINKINPEWVPSAYKATALSNSPTIKGYTTPKQSSIKPLVRRTPEHLKKKTSSK